MGHRAKQKFKPELIYRSRQANRTDIEELLGPNFDPSQAAPSPAPLSSSSEVIDTEEHVLSAPSSSLLPGRNQLPASSEQPGSTLPPNSNFLPASSRHPGSNLMLGVVGSSGSGEAVPMPGAANSSLLPGSNLLPRGEVTIGPSESPEGDQASTLLVELRNAALVAEAVGDNLESPSQSNLLPDSRLLYDNNPLVTSDELDLPLKSVGAAGTRQADRIDSDLMPASTRTPAVLTSAAKAKSTNRKVPVAPVLSIGRLRPGHIQTEQGRIIKIREVRSVQDAHTSGEHDLLQAMWKRGKEETRDTRILQAGLSELSSMSGAHKTSCRAYIRALISKLAIEEVEASQAIFGTVAGARVYRIFSFDEIKMRRLRAGLTHVVRTGAVVFVDPKTGCNLAAGSNLLPARNLPGGSNLRPDSRLHSMPGSNLLQVPGSKLLPASINNSVQQNSTTTTSTSLRDALKQVTWDWKTSRESLEIQQRLMAIDPPALDMIIDGCLEQVPDAAASEIAGPLASAFFKLASNKQVNNPVGVLIRKSETWFFPEQIQQARAEKSRESAQSEEQVRQLREEQEDLERRLREEFPERYRN